MIRLGPFDVEDVVARGGMGEVWRGRHRAQGVPVAVKVMTGTNALSPDYLARFRSEVRAASGLDHPNVVMVFEHGTIPVAASRSSGGQLVAGSPYLVMEFASGGSLAQWKRAHSWSQFRMLMRSLLTAVAHAHARGVLHRDIKPGNVLRCTRSDVRPGLKLADFGISRLSDLEHETDPELISGTVRYMAPEQARGQWRDEGPWTDLYSLGCVAYRLATGAPVPEPTVEGERTLWIPIPPVVAGFETPPGFVMWMSRMTALDPESRFQHAADAAWALDQLGGPVGDEGPDFFADDLPPPHDPDELPTRAEIPAAISEEVFDENAFTESFPATSALASRDLVTDLALPANDAPAPVLATPPIPATWRTPQADLASSPRLLGAGTGLYGLRAVPVVDREAERDRLWSALREVARDGLARMIVLEGASGSGKSRLAEWLCEHAAETGAATPVRAVHGMPPGPSDGLAATFARLHKCGDLAGPSLVRRTRAVLARYDTFAEDDVLAMAQFLSGRAQRLSHDGRVVRLEFAFERHETVRRHVARLARQRPVIVWIDDAQWAADALHFAQYVLDRRERSTTPVLLVATVRADALAERPLERERLANLNARAEVQRIEIGPLPPEHWPVLVRELLGLEGELAQRVEQRTAGNPLFAVQLVGDWVQRGLLVPGPNGFRLRPGSSIELPDTIHQVWAERTAQLLANRDEQDGDALEMAAVLGTDVAADEWREACELAGLTVPTGVVDALLDRKLANAAPDGANAGWSFIHAMFRESLERRASENGRLADHHAICARMLAGRSGRGIAERIGRHALASGDASGALQPLLDGAREHLDYDDAPVALALLELRQEALQKLRAREDDARWGENFAEVALAEVRRGRMNEALASAVQAEEAARRHGWKNILGTALFARARVERWRGMNAESERITTEALQIARALGDTDLAARCEWWLSATMHVRGEADGSIEHAKAAIALFGELEDPVGLARALIEWAIAAHRKGDTEEARARLAMARTSYEKAGSRHGVAAASNQMAEILREEKRLEEAETLYREALEIFVALGSSNALVVRLNIGLTLLARGAYREARDMFEEALPALERSGLLSMLACSHIEVLACCADARDWEAWDAHHIAGTALLRGSDLSDPDLAWAARLAGDLARDAGDPRRAIDAYEVALAQLRGLGRAGDADALAAEMKKLDPPCE